MKRATSLFLGLLRTSVLRLSLACATGFLICIFIWLYPEAQGWPFSRTSTQIFNAIARIATVTLFAGAAVGAVLGLAIAALAWVTGQMCGRMLRKAETFVIFLLAFAAGSLFLRNIMQWLEIMNLHRIAAPAKYAAWGICVCLLALLFSKRRRFNATRATLRTLYTSPTTRRNVLVGGGAATALTLTLPSITSANTAPRLKMPPRMVAQAGNESTKPNILLITFDALNAEDMSLYGYHLPTTPNIDRFARSATVFHNFYSCSTFTTPSVVSFSCGRYPSTTKVFHLLGSLQGDDRMRSMPGVLHQNGYTTAASVANVVAHPAISQIGGYDFAPQPPLRDALVRDGYLLGLPEAPIDFMMVANFCARQQYRYLPHSIGAYIARRVAPPSDSFEQATAIWRNLRGPKFLHVHVLAPHGPYQPGKEFRGRFIDPKALIECTEGLALNRLVTPVENRYAPEYQSVFDGLRLRYDEWICEADDAFGRFIRDLQSDKELENTVIAVSADHGESFQGGVWSHGTSSQIRAIVHVPLIIHAPGQTARQDVFQAADGSRLAPTLLDLAGFSTPSWMDGTSLRTAMAGPASGSENLAFTQYFERNSAFEPITKGTIGVIDGEHQYIVDLQTGSGSLYKLANAHLHSEEIAAKHPDIAHHLHKRIRARFPNIRISA